MSTRNRTRALALLIAGLCLATGALAAGISGSTTPQIGGGIDLGMDGGISSPTAAAAPPGCASPDAPDGAVDLSKCSNAFYLAVLFF